MQKQDHLLPKPWPESPPIYDIEKSYLDNAQRGPFFSGKFPPRQINPKEAWVDFLGHQISSPLGVPAGPLLNSRWVLFAANMGFDIVTYKTIRSKPKAAHPLPNMVYVKTDRFLHKDDQHQPISQTLFPPLTMEQLALTNSFGIPSFDRDFLVEDIAKAQGGLNPGQVMIVSFVGTPRDGEDFEKDFAEAAAIALDGGATILEADLSCPNVSSCEGSLFTDPGAIYRIARHIKKLNPTIPLVIKVGVVGETAKLREVMRAAARGGVDAICGINTMSMRVVKDDGTPALGKDRISAGVCGGPIREVALEFLRWARTINCEENLGLTILGTGGVTKAEHFDLFFDAGADVAMTALGMMWDPYLATRYHLRRKNERCRS
ncbi:MAG: dihydroorotate dehydrogenase [Chlamydiia bacterium]|nr:dihydroorotate dehydrogenase [Chlamydiia bacterium]